MKRGKPGNVWGFEGNEERGAKRREETCVQDKKARRCSSLSRTGETLLRAEKKGKLNAGEQQPQKEGGKKGRRSNSQTGIRGHSNT